MRNPFSWVLGIALSIVALTIPGGLWYMAVQSDWYHEFLGPWRRLVVMAFLPGVLGLASLRGTQKLNFQYLERREGTVALAACLGAWSMGMLGLAASGVLATLTGVAGPWVAVTLASAIAGGTYYAASVNGGQPLFHRWRQGKMVQLKRRDLEQ